jgi:hypothetical protein
MSKVLTEKQLKREQSEFRNITEDIARQLAEDVILKAISDVNTKSISRQDYVTARNFLAGDNPELLEFYCALAGIDASVITSKFQYREDLRNED